HSNGSLHGAIWVPGYNGLSYTNTSAVPLGQWAQVAFVADHGKNIWQFYVNGVLQSPAGGAAGSGIASSSVPLTIGTINHETPGTFAGKIAYVAIYQGRALSGTELTQLDQQVPVTADVATTTVENGSPVTLSTSTATQDIHVAFNGWAAQPLT